MAALLAEPAADAMSLGRAHFITFEGGEGAGKTTQLRLLAASFDAAGIGYLQTREPGGCPPAEAIRALLVSGDAQRWLPETEALLMMAARFEHVQRAILPALAEEKWVLCDRFFDSTRVYQGIAKGLGDAWLKPLYRMLFGEFAPALTLFLDIDAAQGLARTHGRGGAEARFESLPLAFHEQVRAGFTAMCAQEPQRWRRFDAACEPLALHRQIIAAINERFELALAPQERL